jgi:hypothetical protein
MVVINVTREMPSATNSSMRDTIEFYSRSGAAIVFRFNLEPGTIDMDWSGWITLARSTGAHFSFAFMGAVPRDFAFGRKIHETCRRLLNGGFIVKISRPLPACIMSPGQLDFLKNHCNLPVTCSVYSAIPLINPDGRTVFPCSSIPRPLPLEYIWSRREEFLNMADVMEVTRPGLLPSCARCRHLEEGYCQPGCLGDCLRAAGAVDPGRFPALLRGSLPGENSCSI